MKLSVIIPAYNEIGTIDEILRRVKAAALPIEREIIVVDDGSKDGTRDFLRAADGIKFIFHEKNRGKGGAVKTGIEHATGEIIIFQDADLEYDPGDYSAMIAPIMDGRTEAVLGVRIQPSHDERKRKPLYWLTWLGNETITVVTNLLYGNNAGEYEGCYKAFTARLLRAIDVRTDKFDYDNELVCKILKRGHKTVDVPITYRPRNYEEGKKIGWRDGFRILATIVRCRFGD